MIEVKFSEVAVEEALLRQARALRDALETRIQQKLTGEVLQSRSGALAASIVSSVEDDGSSVSVATSSAGVVYAAIHEFGGKTAAHDIVAVKARVLAFTGSVGERFARSVHHPGSVFSARSYLASSAFDMREKIGVGFKQAVLEALGQV